MEMIKITEKRQLIKCIEIKEISIYQQKRAILENSREGVLGVQVDKLINILDLSVYTNIETTTIFHFHSCDLTKCKPLLNCEFFLSKNLPSWSTMVNIWWWYNC